MKLAQLTDKISDPDGTVEISGLTADSREVQPGFLFAALPGVNMDGHTFIPGAIEKGASAILVPTGTPDVGVPMVQSENPRHELALMAARFFEGQPRTIVAVTGTNGKSSTVEFLRQIWSFADKKAACLGTLGVTTDDGLSPMHHTTPDPVSLHRAIHKLSEDGIDYLALEASSHGLVQSRLDGVAITHTGFTNLSQDHFDYHDGFESYFVAKARLFSELAKAGSPAAIMVDGPWGRRMADLARDHNLEVMSVGWEGEDVRLQELHPLAKSQTLTLDIHGQLHSVELPLAGEFQALNAVLALALALQSGVPERLALEALKTLHGVRGRMEAVGTTRSGAPVFVDFAHTPDGLDKLLRALRPHTMGDIHLVFGCGGDRDPLKRPKMGEIATRLADHVIVTDDNPRYEEAAKIRAAVMATCDGATEIVNRKEAIITAIGALKAGDALVIAGKGHESGQIVGDQCIPFDDAQVARTALGAAGGSHD
ncbi:MAG: UDP-N-acetylmuramoyl-L-alanyl-D-glutamate--2,6-diaminopimelate ligase [Robiginitomaculum sp.]|nr:MAG: UDP-N-acetylmuramoyl-L-alanyl-D-glutamate--2,6-diaminopimelate ligase [Robiginitomaculum sp.]